MTRRQLSFSLASLMAVPVFAGIVLGVLRHESALALVWTVAALATFVCSRFLRKPVAVVLIASLIASAGTILAGALGFFVVWPRSPDNFLELGFAGFGLALPVSLGPFLVLR